MCMGYAISSCPKPDADAGSNDMGSSVASLSRESVPRLSLASSSSGMGTKEGTR
jgi:hypothetical protein